MITCYFENQQKAFLRHAVVDALVVKDNQILLIKRAQRYLEPHKWALPGGFVDLNETIDEAVLREVKEETGYSGEIISFFRLNDSPIRLKEVNQNIEFVYLIKPLRLVGRHDDEVSETKWFDLDQLPFFHKIAFDHLTSIKLYKKYLAHKFTLPIL